MLHTWNDTCWPSPHVSLAQVFQSDKLVNEFGPDLEKKIAGRR